jgi:fructose-bisphosphate aldolase class II
MAAKKVSFKELGLFNTREMFSHAVDGGFAVPAFNFNNMEQMQAILSACVECRSPVILQVSKGARAYANQTLLRYMAQGAVEYAKEISKDKKGIPIALNLDHGDSYDLCVSCVDSGFSNVMIDGSHLKYDDNIALTKKVVEYAHAHDVTVEGELGVLAGVEDEVSSEKHHYTKPEEVEDFVKRTGVDSLAISIGTSHGAFKFKPGQKPQLRLDILHECERRIPRFPIVMHGSSSVPQEHVATINKYGGHIEDAIGIPEDQIREAVKSAVCKVNIDSDGRLAMTAAIRKYFAEHPDHYDPRQYMGPARYSLKALYIHKCRDVLLSAEKSWL